MESKKLTIDEMPGNILRDETERWNIKNNLNPTEDILSMKNKDFKPDENGKTPWVSKKSWDDLRSAGLLFFINMILHAFGWALVVEVDSETKLVTNCYPARVRFRGFDEDSQTEEHTKIAKYLAENAPNFPDEIK